MPEDRTIYGDGRTSVEVDEKNVTFMQYEGSVTISRAAFREIVLGWERLQQQEDEHGE